MKSASVLCTGSVRLGIIALLSGVLAAGCGLRVDGVDASGAPVPNAPGGETELSMSGLGGNGRERTGPRAAATGNSDGVAGEGFMTSGSGVDGSAGGDGTHAGAVGPAGTGGRPGSMVGRGVNDKTITIGWQVATDLQAGFAAVGANNQAVNESKIVDALTKWVNDTGGVAGRKLIVVKHETNPTAGSFASQAAAACATFTEDNKVFAVGSSPVGGNDSLLSCLAAKDTPVIEQNSWLFDDEYYRRFPGYLYQPGRASPTRWAKTYVDGLDRLGYFERDAKVGLLRFDSAVFERITNRVLRPAMTAKRHKFTKEIAVREPAGVSDFGGLAAELNNAVISFRAAGVTHLMFLENAGIIPFFFMQQAESQSYRPIYGLTSVDRPTTQEGNQPEEQLRNSYLVGWNPPVDVSQPLDRNPARSKCLEVMKKYGYGGATTGSFLQPICDSMFFLRTVLPKVTSFTTSGLRAATASLGNSYNSPLALGTTFHAGRFDGANMASGGRFNDGCACYKYTGSPFPM